MHVQLKSLILKIRYVPLESTENREEPRREKKIKTNLNSPTQN